MIGTTLGHYRITHLLGQGGMGEVYAAEDLTLGRRVALKVLNRSLAGLDRDRFAREARAIAALSHPGIVTVYSFEEADGVSFLTMELVEGQMLSERVTPRGMPAAELLDIGIQIADAVSAAHDKGVIHRDLKPGNVLVTKDRRLKVLDFGLAKLRGPGSALSGEMLTQAVTGEGRIVGTVAYMSPEQAEGKTVDERSDVFSLGVMLYELATGQRPFQGDTNVSVLSSLLKDTPRSAVELSPALPPPIARVLKTCLQKDPERRYQSAKELRNELRTIKEELASGEIEARGLPAARRPRRGLFVMAAILVLVVGAGVAYDRLMREAAPAPLPTLRHTQVTVAPGVEGDPSLSPDGKWVAYASATAGNQDIYLQSVGGQTAINLTKDSPAADFDPAFSPDGERIAFRSDRGEGGIFVMGRTGEAPRLVTSGGYSPAWSPDGAEIVYASGKAPDPASRVGFSSLRVARADTGASRMLLESDGMNPAWSPDGRFIAYWGVAQTASVRDRDLWVIPAAGGTPWQVTSDSAVDWCPQWSADGKYLYFASDRSGSMNLWRLPLDAGTARPAGAAEALTTPSPYVANLRLASAAPLVAYASRTMRRNVHRATFDPATLAVGPAEPVTAGTRLWFSVAPSPDGQHLALSSSQPQEDLFISRADGSGLRQITTDAAFDRFPEWSPDGSRIAFYSTRSGKYEVWTTTLAGQLTQLTDSAEYAAIYPRWAPDGTRMSFTDVGKNAMVLFDPRKPWGEQTPDLLPRPPRAEPSTLLNPHWSPDGKYIAGAARGMVLLYDVGARTYTDVAKGASVIWLRDGRLGVLGGEPALTVIDPASRKPTPATFTGRPPEWSTFTVRLTRDGRLLYFVTIEVESDIWIADLTGGPPGR